MKRLRYSYSFFSFLTFQVANCNNHSERILSETGEDGINQDALREKENNVNFRYSDRVVTLNQ